MNSSPPNTPALSVVIPVYNSAAELRQCLSALAGSAYSNFEAIVVDDGSDEPVQQIAAAAGFTLRGGAIARGWSLPGYRG